MRVRRDIPAGELMAGTKLANLRELHVYGPETPVGARGSWWQHVGWDRLLLREAERIALEEYDAKEILVLSGVGAREYYRKLGYSGPRRARTCGRS